MLSGMISPQKLIYVLQKANWAYLDRANQPQPLTCLCAGPAFLLGAQPPSAQALELWDTVAGHADVTQVENTIMQWLELVPQLFAEAETLDMSLLILDLLEVPFHMCRLLGQFKPKKVLYKGKIWHFMYSIRN